MHPYVSLTPLTGRNMRSRSNSLEDLTKTKPAQQRQQGDAHKRSAEREEPSGRAEHRRRHREPPDDTDTVQRKHKMLKSSTCADGSGSATGPARGGRREKGRDLSRDDLVFLLSLLEGELQVKQSVDTAEQTWIKPREPFSRYGSRRGTGPSRTCSQTRGAQRAAVSRDGLNTSVNGQRTAEATSRHSSVGSRNRLAGSLC